MAEKSGAMENVDVLRKIFLLLPPRDLAASSSVCKLWFQTASDAWRNLCLQRWPSLCVANPSYPAGNPRTCAENPSPLGGGKPISFATNAGLCPAVVNLGSSSVIKSFFSFFSQRVSNSVDPDAVSWLRTADLTTTLFLDVSFRNRPFFSQALAGMTAFHNRLRFKLPRIPFENSNMAEGEKGETLCYPLRQDLYGDLHVQLSIARHSDGRSACLLNGFPCSGPAGSFGYSSGLHSILIFIDNHVFLNILW